MGSLFWMLLLAFSFQQPQAAPPILEGMRIDGPVVIQRIAIQFEQAPNGRVWVDDEHGGTGQTIALYGLQFDYPVTAGHVSRVINLINFRPARREELANASLYIHRIESIVVGLGSYGHRPGEEGSEVLPMLLTGPKGVRFAHAPLTTEWPPGTIFLVVRD